MARPTDTTIKDTNTTVTTVPVGVIAGVTISVAFVVILVAVIVLAVLAKKAAHLPTPKASSAEEEGEHHSTSTMITNPCYHSVL